MPRDVRSTIEALEPRLLALVAFLLLVTFVALAGCGSDRNDCIWERRSAWVCRDEGDFIMANYGTAEAPVWAPSPTETCRCVGGSR
jgi:hypothetical protein